MLASQRTIDVLKQSLKSQEQRSPIQRLLKKIENLTKVNDVCKDLI